MPALPATTCVFFRTLHDSLKMFCRPVSQLSTVFVFVLAKTRGTRKVKSSMISRQRTDGFVSGLRKRSGPDRLEPRHREARRPNHVNESAGGSAHILQATEASSNGKPLFSRPCRRRRVPGSLNLGSVGSRSGRMTRHSDRGLDPGGGRFLSITALLTTDSITSRCFSRIVRHSEKLIIDED